MSGGRQGVVGSLARWDDARGFGFIQPNEGGPQVFVHITAFGDRHDRPAVGEALIFDVVTRGDGRSQARGVQYLDRVVAGTVQRPARAAHRSARPGRRQPLPLVPVVLLAGYLGIAVVLLEVPWWVPAGYVAMSVLTFALYAVDKHRARTGQWRVAESTLHLAGLACGWPGAVIAQQLLRHKNRKRSFQVPFWILVALNWLLLAALIHGTGLPG